MKNKSTKKDPVIDSVWEAVSRSVWSSTSSSAGRSVWQSTCESIWLCVSLAVNDPVNMSAKDYFK